MASLGKGAKVIQVRISQKMYNALLKEDRSVSSSVRVALVKYLKGKRSSPESRPARTSVRELVNQWGVPEGQRCSNCNQIVEDGDCGC